MAKRKRDKEVTIAGSPSPKKAAVLKATNGHTQGGPINLQVITGSYDRILHGIIATLPASGSKAETQFQDNFLFNAHSSAIRCLALSPLRSEDGSIHEKLTLATGGTDEKVNLYSISTHIPDAPSLPSMSSVPSLENPKNKELGMMLHHDSSVNVLRFPTRSKLISASDDNSIAISRTKDWTLLTRIKAPIPKSLGRPSGDTAPLGGAPSGVNDFAIHPSMKLMISVGKGERCMRLWNLVTGKKANVLNFERDLLQAVGEGKRSKGEGQKVVWNSVGDEFAVAFTKGVAVFGLNSEAKCIAVPEPASKVHKIAYLSWKESEPSEEMLLISTEDGRLLFYPTNSQQLDPGIATKTQLLPTVTPRAVLGGRTSGIDGRIKDFEVVSVGEGASATKVVVTAGSDGVVRIWQIDSKQLEAIFGRSHSDHHKSSTNGVVKKDSVVQVGKLLGKYNTNNRITCLIAFQLQHAESSTVELTAPDGFLEDSHEGVGVGHIGEIESTARVQEEGNGDEAFQGFE